VAIKHASRCAPPRKARPYLTLPLLLHTRARARACVALSVGGEWRGFAYAALVDFVNDDVRDTCQAGVTLQPPQKDACNVQEQLRTLISHAWM